MTHLLKTAFISFFLSCMALPVFALTISPSGIVGIEVNGVLYDVAFEDGNCITVFSGCDDQSDFLFDVNTISDAVVALSEAVRGTIYDTDPSLIDGCDDSRLCNIRTPYAGFSDHVGSFAVVGVFSNDTRLDSVSLVVNVPIDFFQPNDGRVFAVWSVAAVPVPGSVLFIFSFCAGFLGINAMRKTKKRRLDCSAF